MNIWCLRPTKQSDIMLLEEFSKDNDIKLDLLTVGKDFYDKTQYKKILSENVEVKNAKDLAINFEINNTQDSFDLGGYSNVKFQKYKNISLNLFDRNERYFGEISLQERERYIFKQYVYWSSKLKNKSKIDLIVFFDIPHIYYEYTIIGLAKLYKIPIIIIKSNTRNTFFFNEDLEPIVNLNNSLTFKNFFNQLNIEENNETENLKNSSAIFKNILILFRFILFTIPKSFLLKFNKRYKEISFYIKNDNYSVKNNSDLNENFYNLKYVYSCILREVEYKKISSKKIPQKFVYLPLISNHEADLFPGCWPWNIEKVIEYLLLKLHNTDYTICIKEHPRQFKIRYHQNFNRHKDFYKKYSKNKKIVFISLNTENEELIKKSEAVVCSSLSSTALQSIKLGKKVIFFGPNILDEENSIRLEDFENFEKTPPLQKKDSKIYFPYKQIYKKKKYNLMAQDFDRTIKLNDLVEIKKNIIEYYRIISK